MYISYKSLIINENFYWRYVVGMILSFIGSIFILLNEVQPEQRKQNDRIDYNIFKSTDNVNLNCILGTKKDGVYKSFLEDYDKE